MDDEHIVYKWVCKDLNIKDFYIGYTKNFDKRIISHKRSYNKTFKFHEGKKYNFVREKGGWDNWKFIEIASFENMKDARDYERILINALNPSLNCNGNNMYYIEKYYVTTHD